MSGCEIYYQFLGLFTSTGKDDVFIYSPDDKQKGIPVNMGMPEREWVPHRKMELYFLFLASSSSLRDLAHS